MKKSLFILTLFFCLVATASPKKNTTTIFYYLSGDNNLSFMMDGIIQRLEQVGSSSKVTALVQSDGPVLNDSIRFKVLKPRYKKARREIFQSDVEYDMGNVQTLKEFLDWGMKAYPAQKYILYIAGHGLGVMKFAETQQDYTKTSDFITMDVAVDWDSDHAIAVNDFAIGLKELINKDQKPFELIVFNSCLMGNLETVIGLQKITNYVLASEYEIQLYTPSFDSAQKTDAIGIDGATLLKSVRRNYRNYSIEMIANAIAKQFQSSYENGIYDVYLDKIRYLKATLALFDTAHIDKVVTLFRDLSTDLSQLIEQDGSIVDQIYIRTLGSPLVYWFDYLDAITTLKIIAEVTHIESSRLLLNLLEKDGLVAMQSLVNAENVTGLSLYFPKYVLGNPSWPRFLKTYFQQDFSIQTGWGKALDKYASIWGQRRKNIIQNLLQSYFDGTPQIITEDKDLNSSIEYLKDIIFILLCNLKDDNQWDDIQEIVEILLPHKADPIIFQILEDIDQYISDLPDIE